MKVFYTSRTLSGGKKFGHIINVPDGVTPVQACVEHRLSFLGWEPTPPPMLFRTYDGMLNTTCEAYVKPLIKDGERHVSIRIVDPRVEDTNEAIRKEQVALGRRKRLRIVKEIDR